MMTFPQSTEAQTIAAKLIAAAATRIEMPLILAAVANSFPHLGTEDLAAAAEAVAHEIRRAQVVTDFTEIREHATGDVRDFSARPARVSGCCGAPVHVEFTTGTRRCQGCEAVLERPAPGALEHAFAGTADADGLR